MPGKQYTFFRNAKGKPSREERDAPNCLLAELGKASTASGDGVGFSFDTKKVNVAIEAGFLVIDPDGGELNETDSSRILWDSLIAIMKAAPSQAIKSSQLLDKSNEFAREFFQLIPQKYLAISSLSIEELPAKTIVVNECEITGIMSRALYPLPGVLSHRLQGSSFWDHLNSTKYKHIRVATAGRSVFQAIENATSSVDLLRGLWSLFATYRSWRQTLFGSNPKQRALGVIHTGPVHTLHNLDRSVVGDVYWFEQILVEDRDLFKPTNSWTNIEKHRRWATRRLRTLPYRVELKELFIRYAEALDQTDMGVAFLKMWGILEKLTQTVGDNYDETIRRATWLFSDDDKDVAREMLKSLRSRRNLYVHAGKTSANGDQVAYLIKMFVDAHLVELIKNPCGCRNLDEYAEVLSLPREMRDLQRKQR